MKPYIYKLFTPTSSVKNLHLRFTLNAACVHFHGLIAHLFLSPNNISLHGCTTVCLPIHVLKEILAASRFGFVNKVAISNRADSWVDISYQLI